MNDTKKKKTDNLSPNPIFPSATVFYQSDDPIYEIIRILFFFTFSYQFKAFDRIENTEHFNIS